MKMKKLIAALAAASMLASSAAALAAGTEPVDSGAVVMTDAEAPDEAAPEAVEDEAVTEDETVEEAELFEGEVAQIGETGYATLQAAINAAEAGDTVTLLSDTSETDVLEITKSITIDGDDHTVNSSATRILWVDANDVTLNLNNINFVGDGTKTERGLQLNLDMTGGVWNLDNVTVSGITYYAVNICNGGSLEITAKDSHFEGWSAFNAWGADYTADFERCTFVGINDKGAGQWNNFGTFVLEGDTTGQTGMHSSDITCNLKDCTIIAGTIGNGNYQSAVLFNKPSAHNHVVISGKDSQIILRDGYSLPALGVINNNILDITGGTYDFDPSYYVPAGYATIIRADGKYEVIPVAEVENYEVEDGYVLTLAYDNVYEIVPEESITEPGEGNVFEYDGEIVAYATIYDVPEDGGMPVQQLIEVTSSDAVFTDGNGDEVSPDEVYLRITPDVTAEESADEDYAKALDKAVKSFEIEFVDAFGGPVVFTGTATVKIPYNPNGAFRLYYVAPDGTKQNMNAVYEEPNIVFTTDHFSTYTIEQESDITENVGIGFRKAAADLKDASASTDNLYDIIVSAKDADKFINELASADLVFDFDYDGGVVAYEVTAKEHVNLIADPEYHRYEFNYDGYHEFEESGKDIVIGQVRFSGYGKYSFVIDTSVTAMDGDSNVNIVNATKFNDNIVDTYSVSGNTLGTYDDEFVKNDSPTDLEHGRIEDEINAEKVPLRINVAFPNDAKEQAVAYNDMKVTLSGGDLPESYVIDLGDDYTPGEFKAADGTTATVAEAYNKTNVAGTEYNAYVIDVTDLLTENVAYTVTVEGEGYRTARYTVNMGEKTTDAVTGEVNGKTLTFWNNVMDNALAVEKDSSKTMIKNYLAGDIVKDNIINLYDLSAVVSYFGTTNLITANPEYVKYDLNRDGMIDSKDIAYVLVSWEN